VNAVVGIVMGSDSDWPVMRAAAEVLDDRLNAAGCA
jgi:phosphoribosylcarboxyaminoimidazole (NCAIR) mutase